MKCAITESTGRQAFSLIAITSLAMAAAACSGSTTTIAPTSLPAPTAGLACEFVTVCGPGWISLVAGSIGGAGHIDAIGTAARFTGPYGVAIDRSGNIYVSDSDDRTIRKLTPEGVVTTLAGSTGVTGSADGAGAQAAFSRPLGITSDGAGNVYVADGYSTIRKITPGGTVTTLAGTAGVTGTVDGFGGAAQFARADSVAADPAGNVYVGDHGAIRKVTPSGQVTTLAGRVGVFGVTDGVGADARFSDHVGLAADGLGNVYVIDTYSRTVRKVTPSGTVTTLAGQANVIGGADGKGVQASFVQPTHIAVDAEGNLYVVDRTCVRKVAPDGTVTTVAGLAGDQAPFGIRDGVAANARFGSPSGLAVDGAGNVYLADQINRTLRKIAPNGVVSTFAGAALVSGSADGEAAVATFLAPTNPAMDGAGNVYLADQHAIRKIAATGVVTTVAGGAEAGTTDGLGAAARFAKPTAVAVDRAGNLYVTDVDFRHKGPFNQRVLTNTIRKITPAGRVTTLAGSIGPPGAFDGSAAQARFSRPYGIAVDGNGNLYVGDCGNHAIRKVTLSGVVSTFAGSAGLSGSADGAGTAARFNCPTGVALDEEGNVYVADSGNATVRKIAPLGAVTTLAGTAGKSGSTDGTGAAARFTHLFSLTVDKAGNVFAGDIFEGSQFVTNSFTKYPTTEYAGRIRKITRAGVVTTVAGNGTSRGIQLARLPGSLYQVNGIVSDGDNGLYVATSAALLKVQLP